MTRDHDAWALDLIESVAGREQRLDRFAKQAGQLEGKGKARVVSIILDGVDRLPRHFKSITAVTLAPRPGRSKLTNAAVHERLRLERD